ncbi:hypothetical protein Y1Q_0014003 [Alligator mississippiensis]|uniref:Uncharacterized protein n=1 Tax=Alligator mississippiensis TaxID=8496 RepID=A0A151PDR5_ALLMI|nr:hypothetical protein Y1Q_0014003 [Alligator mississippiensis]
MYGITKESLARTPLKEESKEVPRTMTQPGAQKQVPGGDRPQSLLVAVAPKDSSLMVLVTSSLQDLGAEVFLQLDLSSLDTFSGIVKSMTYGVKEQGKTSNVMDIKTQDQDPRHVPSTLHESQPDS